MDSVKSRIEEIQKDMDASYNELRSLALRLAGAACADDNEEISLIAPTLRTAFISARDNFNSIKSRKLQMDELRARQSEGEESLSRLQKEKNSTERKLRERRKTALSGNSGSWKSSSVRWLSHRRTVLPAILKLKRRSLLSRPTAAACMRRRRRKVLSLLRQKSVLHSTRRIRAVFSLSVSAL